MRGNVNIVNTADDLESSTITREQVIAAATIKVRTDAAVYPDDYDTTLKEGDEGYIEPDYQYDEKIDQAVLDRFGIIL
ncbi:hypothetical protein C0J08_20155 [Marinomonas sp. CT5]|uniref:hypothetical protein n=1 Tax=Marinomonas sp. CT5 TaxID=2066133 RepID=UPI001BB0A95C|nr:hypothetical protein [Marinomonas sp. CT5]QUX97573.1 hypothetical protein C0J08_20155 [Marinomonas sp. CT5]